LEDRVCLEGEPAYPWPGQCRERWLEGEPAYLWLDQCMERWPEGELAYLWLGQCRERWPEEPGHLLGEWVRPQLLDLLLLLDYREHQLWLA
jgi:hypothetical protein